MSNPTAGRERPALGITEVSLFGMSDSAGSLGFRTRCEQGGKFCAAQQGC